MAIHQSLLELREHWHIARWLLFAVIVVTAIGVAFRVFIRNCSDAEWSDRHSFKLFLLTVIGWSFGMCANGVVRGLATYLNEGRFVFAGFEELGGILFSVGLVALYCKKSGLPVRPVLDLYFLSVLVYLSISALGCFVVGCCDGIESQVPWAIAGPAPLPGDVQKYFHPTQLYAVGAYFLFFVLSQRLLIDASAGQLSLFALTSIFVFRFFIQFWKHNHATSLGVYGLDDLQLTALVVWAAIGIPILSGMKIRLTALMPSVLKRNSGFTLFEMMMVLALLGILYKVYTAEFGNTLDAQRYEETRARLEGIRRAILGDRTIDNQGKQSHFGYVGDMGNLPATLANLVTIGAQTAWAFSTWHQVGAGWRGPYLQEGPTGSITYSKDAWGNTITYDTSLPATIRSYASDNANGGTGYATDMTLSIPSTDIKATVKGTMLDREAALNGGAAWLWYPVAGVLTGFVVGANAYGDFSTSDVPFGIRSLGMVVPTIRQFPITVDRAETTVPIMNSSGGYKLVTMTGGTKKQGASTSIVQATLASGYDTDLVIRTIVVASWTPGPANLVRVGLNGMSQTVAVGSAGGTITVTARLNFIANQSVNIFELEFDGDASATTMPELVFSYTNNTRTDTVNIG